MAAMVFTSMCQSLHAIPGPVVANKSLDTIQLVVIQLHMFDGLLWGCACSGGVTIEWQRQRAKEMRQFFQDKKLEAQVKKSQCVTAAT